jgi:hypothetical protein
MGKRNYACAVHANLQHVLAETVLFAAGRYADTFKE